MKGFKNSTKTRSGHSFPTNKGFSGSSGKVREVKSYTRKSPMRKAEGGAVTAPGNALTQRSAPQPSVLDAVSGGKSPLRPGFSRGGMSGKKC